MQIKPLLISVLVLGLSLGFSLAWADQCQAISAQQAAAALDYLKPDKEIIDFCEPCGAKNFRAQDPETIRSLKVEKDKEDDYWGIEINGKERDLAYTFLRTEDGSYLNVSKLANCPSSDVSVGFPPP